MFTFLQFGHQPLVLAFTQQVPANCGHVQITGVEIDQCLIALRRRRFINAFCFGSLERIIHLPPGHQQAAERAITGQLFPAFIGKFAGADIRHRRPAVASALNQTELGTNTVGCFHDDFVDHHHRNSGARQAVHSDATLGRLTAHRDPLVRLEANVLVRELVHLAFGNADKKNRLIVVYHPRARDLTLGVQYYHGV